MRDAIAMYCDSSIVLGARCVLRLKYQIVIPMGKHTTAFDFISLALNRQFASEKEDKINA